MSTLFSGHYFLNRSTLDIGVLGYIGIVQHKEHSPEVLSIPPGTPCIYKRTTAHTYLTSMFRQTSETGCHVFNDAVSKIMGVQCQW